MVYQTMLYRVVMNVVHVTTPVLFIANQMLPEPGLPNRCLAVAQRQRQSSRNVFFDFPPPARKIAIVLRQVPNAMQVIRQDNHAIDFKRLLCFDGAYGLTQKINRRRIGQEGAPLSTDYGKEIAST